MRAAQRLSRHFKKCNALLLRDCNAFGLFHQHQPLEARLCSSTSLAPAAQPPTKERHTSAEEKTINSIWTSACLAGNPNTTAVDFPPGYSRFVIPPVEYQQTPWLERPAAGFNPIFPWIDASIDNEMGESGEGMNDNNEGIQCNTKRTYQPNSDGRSSEAAVGVDYEREVEGES